MECYGLSETDTEKYPSHFTLVGDGGRGSFRGFHLAFLIVTALQGITWGLLPATNSIPVTHLKTELTTG